MDGFNQLLQNIPNFIPNFCDRCGAKHSKHDLEIVNKDPDRFVCRVMCSNCGNISLMQVNIMPDGGVNAKRASVISDILPNEISKFSNSPKIAEEEILDVMIALEKVNSIGDLEYLLKEGR